MRRNGRRTAAVLALALGSTLPGAASIAQDATELVPGEPSVATETSPTKVNIMGLWAHPDDDAGFTTPCGVWQDLYDVTCGIIMMTRGEGGSNSVGPEAGPDLGLRRENEDRTSHIRSGTVDIFNVDMVDFFYNTSAPLTAEVWDKEVGLRQTVRIIRETQPDILMASNPRAAGHGNHQYAQGRMVWEASKAAADPAMYPEQLTGPDAVDVWQVKKIVGAGSTTGTGGWTDAPDCTTGFVPAANNPYTVVGYWTGYESPYTWAEGNVQGMPAGTFKTWAQVGREGGRAHPTQARVMEKGVQAIGCGRYAVPFSLTPFQPNTTTAAGQDDAILFGAVIADPGGMPLGSQFSLEASDFFQAPGTPFTVTVTARSGSGTVDNGNLSLEVPAGWSVTGPVLSGPITDAATVTKSFTVTPAADAPVALNRIAAHFDNGVVTAYNDTRVQVVQEVEGRFVRWGNQAEYEQWAAEYTWLGDRGSAILAIGAGETVTVPVEVTNRSTAAKSGTVGITLPAGLTANTTEIPFTDLAAGASQTVEFLFTHTDPAALASTVQVPIVTTVGAISSTDTLAVTIVPTTVIPELAAAPTLDGIRDAGEGYGSDLSLANRWEGSACADAADCGGASVANLGWHGDDLYVYTHVVDDRASGAVTPDRCFGHWLVDSVELLLDPQGNSVDTSTTFKSGIFPFTNDPENFNGNGVNGPCWSRDADNHQGFSTGPLADDVKEGPNSPGQEVAVQAVVAGDGTYQGGGWTIEVKIPLANLPAAVGPTSNPPTGDAATNDVDPSYLGLNVTPYDSDRLDFIGETRTAWSAIGGQQSEPYRWGHAYLDGYTPPGDRSAESAPAIIPDTALRSTQSPQSIHQSATRGVTLAGYQPSRAMTVDDVAISGSAVTVDVTTTAPGTARVYLWSGNPAFIPVWVSSCAGDTDGFDACSPSDGTAPPWSPDMSGRLVGSAELAITEGSDTVTVPIDAAGYAKLGTDGLVLVSFDGASGVNAWSFPVEEGAAEPTFSDVPADHPFATEIEWAAGQGVILGYEDGTFLPAASATRQAMAAFLYRLHGEGWEPTPGTVTFPDVPETHPFHTEIEWAAAEGVVAGYPDGTFGPAGIVSRQAAAAFLYRVAGEPAVMGASGFSDVPGDHPFADAITWAAQQGIVEGYSDGTFRPAGAVSRQAAAAFLYRSSAV